MTWQDEPNFERLNGADLYFEVTGPEDPTPGEPTLVFLHGGPGYNAYTFRTLFGERLEDRRVVYLDQRGSGRSGPLADTDQGDEALDLDTLTDDVEAVREFLGFEQIVPLGHGFGALIALAMTAGRLSGVWLLLRLGQTRTMVAGGAVAAAGMVLASLIGFTLLYAVLIVADVYLLAKYAKADPADVAADVVPSLA